MRKMFRRLVWLALIALGVYYCNSAGDVNVSDPQEREVSVPLIIPPARVAPPVVLPEPSAPPPVVELRDGSVDRIYVDKSERVMTLYQGEKEVRRFTVGLGFSPEGQKTQEGDGKTPTGRYIIDWRNPESSFYRSLHVSYPTSAQIAQAQTEGRNPGGMIMIHGQPNDSQVSRIPGDWTLGCIAVSDEEMDEIWRVVRNGAEIEIVE